MISSKQVGSFKKNGYLIVDNIFSKKQLLDMELYLKKMVSFIIRKAKKKHPEYKYRFDKIGVDILSKGIDVLESTDHSYISEFYDSLSMSSNPYVARMISSSKVLSNVNSLLNKSHDAPLFITSGNVLFAYPNDNKYTANKWHTDIFYTFPISESVLFWAPLIENSREELGALHVMPGSHTSPFEGEIRDVSRKDSDIHRYTVSDDLLDKYEDKVVELKLGQGVFFDKHLVHRGGYNVSNRSRFSMVGFYHTMDNDNFTPYTFSHPKSPITADEYFDQMVLKVK
jgi:ectoine hydroxylase-related dioxygenase (phytanoyl-CoA dioxygenase family)